MKALGRLLRSFLNINTIWGLMILSAFLLCVAQHYWPTTTVIPAAELEDGDNTIAISTLDREKNVQTHEYRLTQAAQKLTIRPEDQNKQRERPWLISTKRIGDGYVLKWDFAGYGDYEVAVRHYHPASTAIPDSAVQDGANVVVLRATDADGKTRTFGYTLLVESGKLAIPSEDRAWAEERPRPISVERDDAGYALQWDRDVHGQYEIAVGRLLASGKLVTLQSLTDAAFDFAESGFSIAFGLVAAMVLFLGLMRVGQDAGIVQLVARLFYPIIRFLFPEVPKDHPANGAILMNVTTTVLGLGNAATPFGIKAMKELQTLNKHPEVATDSQVMLLGYNTAGFALLPTTLLAVRKASGCSDPFEIIGTCMLAGAVSTVVAIIMVKFLGKLPFFSLKSALAEHAKETPVTPATEDTPAKATEEEDA